VAVGVRLLVTLTPTTVVGVVITVAVVVVAVHVVTLLVTVSVVVVVLLVAVAVVVILVAVAIVVSVLLVVVVTICIVSIVDHGRLLRFVINGIRIKLSDLFNYWLDDLSNYWLDLSNRGWSVMVVLVVNRGCNGRGTVNVMTSMGIVVVVGDWGGGVN